jgi:hypothetical protein
MTQLNQIGSGVRAGALSSVGPSLPNVGEGAFSELPLYRVLGSSRVIYRPRCAGMVSP